MIDTFQGDPAIQITNDGANIVFKGGQPVMDQGLENQAQIALFSDPSWPGNLLLADSEKIGSDFEEVARNAITISGLALVEKSAESALDSNLFGRVTASAINPESWRKDVTITIEPPGADIDTILLSQNGSNWINQSVNPAHKRF